MLLLLILIGLFAGFLSGLLGIGGGIVLVPILHAFYGLDIKMAIGTSLFAIVPTALAGTVSHYRAQHIHLPLALLVAAGAVLGAVLGAWITSALDAKTLRQIFGLFLFFVALHLIFGKGG